MRPIRWYTFIVVLILVWPYGHESTAQVIEGDVMLYTQAEVDAFVGTSITGRLLIGSD
ncbi:hypothetical protein ACFLRO_02125 [Bacteroidota bacterium]